MSIHFALLAFLVLVAAQGWVLFGLGRRSPVGDEKEYLARSASSDPYAPGLFLRPPGMALVAHLSGSEAKARAALALAGCATAALAATAAWLSAGGLVALLALLWLLLPERLILACHIWPDTLLGLVTAGVILAFSLANPADPPALLLLATLAMLGSLIRVDFACVAPLSAIGLAASGQNLDLLDLLLLLAPTVLALALWTWRNGRRYGRWLYEDTWAFNVMLAAEPAATMPARRDFALEPIVAEVAGRWVDLPVAERTAGARRFLVLLGSRPLRMLARAARRVLAFVGPDTFVRQMVLAPGAAYPELSPAARRLAEPSLRFGFPLLATVCLFGTFLTRSAPPVYLLPIAGTLLGSVLFHLRTRYRVAVMPALAVWAAEVGARSVPLLRERSLGFAALVLALGLGVTWLLGRIEYGREMPHTRTTLR